MKFLSEHGFKIIFGVAASTCSELLRDPVIQLCITPVLGAVGALFVAVMEHYRRKILASKSASPAEKAAVSAVAGAIEAREPAIVAAADSEITAKVHVPVAGTKNIVSAIVLGFALSLGFAASQSGCAPGVGQTAAVDFDHVRSAVQSICSAFGVANALVPAHFGVADGGAASSGGQVPVGPDAGL